MGSKANTYNNNNYNLNNDTYNCPKNSHTAHQSPPVFSNPILSTPKPPRLLTVPATIELWAMPRHEHTTITA